jgi:hypothetical protein
LLRNFKRLCKLGLVSFFMIGCGSAKAKKCKKDTANPEGEKLDEKEVQTYEICKYKGSEGTVSDNCAFAVLEDGTCGSGVKVVSEKPASQFGCVVEL